VAVQSYEFGPPAPGLAFAEERGTADHDAGSEFDLLLDTCAAAIGTAEGLSRFPPSVNWRTFADIAERHDVTSLVYSSLHGRRGDVPPPVLEHLRHSYLHNAQKNLRLTSELIRILDCLAACGVEAIPYKGPVLAETLYGNVAIRQFSDLDVLIRPRNLRRALEAVSRLGYSPAKVQSGPEEQACIANGYERAFDGPFGKNLLEVQWRIVPRFYSIGLDVEGLFARSSPFSLGDWRGRTLSSEDLLLALCVHAAKHAWIRLSWLCDIVRMLQTQKVDHEVVRRRAVKLGVARIMGVSLWLAHRLLRMPVPESLRGLMEKDAMVAPIGETICPLLLQPAEFDVESPAYFRLMLRARERRMDKLRFLARLAFTPGAGEWSAIRLPDPLFSLYRVVRIARLSSRAISEVFAKS